MIELTYLHWHTGKRGLLLVNPDHIIAVSPSEREGVVCSQICALGYSYSVAETVEEISALIKRRVLDREHVGCL